MDENVIIDPQITVPQEEIINVEPNQMPYIIVEDNVEYKPQTAKKIIPENNIAPINGGDN